MGFTDDFYDALNKEKKKKQNQTTTSKSKTDSRSDYSSEFYSSLGNDVHPIRTAALMEDDDDIAPVREATWGDVLGGSFSRGYQNSVLGSETYKKIIGQENEADIAKSILEQDKYQFDTDNLFKMAVSGAMEQLGQQWYNLTDPETRALMIGGGATGAGMAAVGGQLGPQALLPEEVVTVPAGFLAGVSAGYKAGSTANAFEVETGSAYNELIEMGVSEETAKKIALGVGGVNAGLELAQVDELVDAFKIVKKAGSDSLIKKVGKILVDIGIDVAKETAEEVAQEGVTIAGTQLGSKLETGEWAYDKGEVVERLGETALSSALTFGVMNVPATLSNVSSVVKQNHYANKLTASEQGVVNKIYETELEQKQSDGKELSKKEKDEIYDSIVDRMEHGQIDIDTIESVLGGDAYKAYKDTVESEDALKNELSELRKMKSSDMNDIQVERMNELKGMNLDDTTKRDGLRKALDDTLSPMLKNSKLTESYRERERRGQAFEADLSQYTGKQREAVERAVKSGVLNNTYRSRELVDVLSKIEAEKGIAFDYTNNAKLKESGFAVDGKTVNGYANKSTGSVTLNVQSAKAWQSVVGHEITHVLEGTESYGALRQALYAYANSKGELEGRRTSISALYHNMDADIEAELTADLVGDYLFTDKNFVDHLTGDRTLFQKIYDEIKYLWNVATGKERDSMERLVHEFDRAWKELSAKGDKAEDGKVQYSISEIVGENNQSYGKGVKLDSTLLENLTPDERVEMVKERVKELGGEVITAYDNNGNAVDVTIEEWGRKFKNKNGKNVPVNKDLATKYIDNETKQEAVVLVDELILTAKYGDSKAPAYPHGWLDNNGANNWEYWTTYIQDKNNTIWQATLNIATTADGEKILYDVSPIKKAGRSVKSDTLPAGDSISPLPENVNTQFSISSVSDADYMSAVERGDTETAQEMVDEAAKNAGYSIKAYHGTGYDFTVFDKSKQGDNYKDWGRLGKGFYFAPTHREAETWAELSRGGKNKVMPVYLKSENMLDSFEALPDNLKDTIPADWDSLTRRLAEKYAYNYIEYMQEFGYDVQKILREKGYDGINGHVEYVLYDPEQIKSAEAVTYSDEGEVIPLSERFNTKHEDIRFSLSNAVEETKDLMALHNLQASELVKTLELGGLPMPSIAVIKDNMSHEQYGDVSLILPKEAVDPAANKDNKVYGGDAWTPTYPKIEYKPNEKVAKKIRDKYYGLANVIGYDEVRPLYNYVNDLENTLNRDGGETAMLEKLYNDTGMMNLYLQDSGKGKVEPITRETVTKISEAQTEMNQWFIDALGEEFVESFKAPDGENPMKYRSAFMEQHEEKIRDAYKRYFMEVHGFTAEEIENVFENIGKRDLMAIMRDAYKYTQNNGVAVKTETDYEATSDAIRTAASDGYKEWVDGLFKGIEEKSGIRNNQDYYTRSGNPRSWDALHWENTLENVIKVMKGQAETGVDSFSPFNSLFGSSHKRYGSIQEIKADSGRLGMINQDEYDAMKDSFSERFAALASSIKDPDERNLFIATDTAAEQIIEAVRSKKTKTGILNHLKALNSRANMQTVEELLSLVSDIANMPTGYFEAKPQRAVGLEEVGVFVIPRNADVKLKQELLNRGYSIAEYDPDVEGDRQRVVNGFEEYKFSLSNVGEEDTHYGNYSTPFRDLALEDVAPVKETVALAPKAAPAMVAEEHPEDYAPVTEEEADALSKARYEAITDADAPPEMPAPYYGESIEPIDPFESRDMKEVGSQKVKAYMYENPEVKPFFQQEAEIMLGDLYRTTRGERVVDADMLYETGGEAGAWGVKRHTAPDIAELKDKWGYTYDEIEAGIKAIIEDNGKENNACSKRIEFMLNDRLMNGYKDFVDGFEIPENREYIRLVKEKGITEYNEEARKHFFEDVERYIPPADEDIAPVAATETPFPDAISPMTVDEANAMQDDKARADAAAEGLPKSRKQLHKNILDDVKATFTSGGYDFDDVLAKAKNLSTFSTVDNTPQRVMEKALGYKEGGILADLTVNRVAQNETAGIRWLNGFTDRKNGLLAKISKQYRIKPGSKESAAAQMYAEGFYVNDNNDIVAYGDAELAKDFPDVGAQYRIKGLAHDPRIRQIYDETLEAINASRTRNAYPEIQKLDNYFLHFRAMDDTFSKLGLPFNPNDIRAKDLPTDLNGVTADLKPGQPYFASAMHRTGKRTSFDLLGGLERYLTSAKNQIYHIDDIQTLRALRNYIADTYGQANGLEGIDVLSEEAAQEKIEMVYNSHLSTFAKFLNEEANVLAGKTALIDRGLEGVIGRRGMTFLDTVNRQVGSNMVGFNISSSLTNFLPVAQTFAKTNKFDFTKAFAQTVSNKISSIFGKSDGFTENSPVVIRRKGADRFYRTPWQKAGDAGYVLMSAVDDISTELIARTKYNELTRKGMDEQTAHFETDKWVSRLMGDRSLGQQPQLYNSKTLGIFTKFQLEVRNQLDAQFYDTIQEAKVSNEDIENALARNAKTAAKVASTFVQLAVVQHLYGKAFESVAGYNPAFDIISTLATMFGFDDEEESEDTALDNIEQGFLALLEDLPYTSTFTGGRIPISSALPVAELIKGVDQYGNEKSRLETLGEVAPYYVLPGGYGQIKKTAAGLGMFSDEHPISGSYTDSGNLRFPVDDTPANRVQAAIFGQYASENAREYFDNDYAPLNEKQIQEYVDVDMPIKEYREYREGLKGLTKIEEKLDYISGLDLPVSKKNILANNVTDRKEPIDLTNYEDFSSLEEFDFANKQPEKYAFAKSVGGYSSYKTYSDELNDIKADKDAAGKSISGSRKEKVLQYINDLDADYYTKIILYKSEYPSEDAYNAEIIEYLNGRGDLTYEDRVSILTELGFRVTADGQIYAD